MSDWTSEEVAGLKRGMQLVLERKRFWPDQETFDLNQRINAMPATEVAVVKDGKLLLQYRKFGEGSSPWPTPFNIVEGWYIPGGFIRQPNSLVQECLDHIRKDLRGEYARAGVSGFDLNSIKLGEPAMIGVHKWMPGEHPSGCPLSIICVCELLAGAIVETDYLKWFDKPVATNVQWHGGFIRQVFAYIKASREYQNWFRNLAGEIDVVGTDFLTNRARVV